MQQSTLTISNNEITMQKIAKNENILTVFINVTEVLEESNLHLCHITDETIRS